MKSQKFVSVVLSVTLSFLGVAAIAYGATVISTSITTDGTLAVTGATTLSTASTTGQVKLDNLIVGQVSAGATISSAGAIFSSSTLKIYGASTLVGAVGVTGLTTLVNASTTGPVSIANNLMVNGNATTTSAGAISTKSTLDVTGVSTLAGGLVVTGTASVSATTTLSSGLTLGKSGLCIDFFATSTQTATKLEFDAAAATTTSPIGGLMLNYGSCN